MKIALVHDWLNGLRGGERCLQAFLSIYPQADIFTLLHHPGTTTEEIDARVKMTSFLQRIPGSKSHYRQFLPLYPAAVKRFDLRGYDIIISLSHAAAKNVVVPDGTLHICYCFTPMRYIWDQAEAYFGWKKKILWPVVERLRSWDLEGSESVHQFVGISKFIAARIQCFYSRDSEVIYPPVDTSWINERVAAREIHSRPGEAFLCAGALVPYKRADAVIEAFNRLGEELWVAGTGPCEGELRRKAGPNIKFLGYLSDAELAECYRRCRALVFAGTEDFGMMPIECMAAGRPVIALHGGGLKESIEGIKPWAPYEVDMANATGVCIRRSDNNLADSIIESVELFMRREDQFSERVCKRRAALFGPDRFFNDWGRLARHYGIDAARAEELTTGVYA